MKIFTKKRIKQMIIIILVVILLLECTVPNISNAKSSGFGGVLFTPIQDLVLGIGDVGTIALNLFIYNYGQSVISLRKDKGLFEKFYDVVSTLLIPVGAGVAMKVGKVVVKKVSASFNGEDFKEEIELPVMLVTMDKIVSNEIPLLDVNIINPNEYKDKNGNVIESSASILQKTIAKWYTILRDIVIVAFLSILVYIGIRILISSLSEDKAKYKQMLIDWIIGLCLLFLMHYIMSFALMMVEKLTEVVSIGSNNIVIESSDVDLAKYNGDHDKVKALVEEYNENGVGELAWKTDFMGYIRFRAQSNINSVSIGTKMAYVVMYIVLVIYTYMFLFKYLKRLLYIVFLTLLAPIVALTYPLEKNSKSGSAQAFNMWIKEYIFNLLLQPMHLILYIVLVGTALDLVVDYPLYGLIALGGILEAEKLVRKMFKFDGAQTTSPVSAGALTGAMVMQGVNSVVSKFSGGNKDGNKKSGLGKGSGDNDSRVRLAENRTANNSADEDDYINNVLADSQEEDNRELDNEYIPEAPQGEEDLDWNLQHPFEDKPDSIDNGYMPEIPQGEEDLDWNLQHPFEDNPNNMLNEENNREQDSTIEFDENSDNKNLQAKNSGKRHKVKDKISKAGMYGGAMVRLYGPKLGMKMAKGAVMAIGAGTASTIAIGAALATDDNKNLLTYGLAGVTGGAMLGKSLTEKIYTDKERNVLSSMSNKMHGIKDNVVKEAFKNNPEEYKRYLNERSDQEFLQNKEMKQQYAEAFGENKAGEMMKSAIKYREHGVTDNKIIIKAMKQKSSSLGIDVTDDRRIVAAKLASNVSNEKDMESMTKRLRDRGISDKKIKEQERIIRNIKGLI